MLGDRLKRRGKGNKMSNGRDDLHQLVEHKRILDEIEKGTRLANREILHERIPSLNRENILALAVSVGRLRARYLEAAFKLAIDEHGEPPNREEVDELRLRREMYEEVKHAHEALRDAISKGYVDAAGFNDG